jgi:hypothetical protein
MSFVNTEKVETLIKISQICRCQTFKFTVQMDGWFPKENSKIQNQQRLTILDRSVGIMHNLCNISPTLPSYTE